MSSPLVAAAVLSPTTRARIQACGHPVVYSTKAGDVGGRWSCGSTWCKWCSARRASRAHRRIAERLEPLVESVYQVTLSLPRRNDLSLEYLRSQLELIGAVWRSAMSRVRWYAHRHSRGDVRCGELVPPPKRDPRWSSEWNGWSWRQHGDWTSGGAGLWVREITTGAGGRGWHVHIHAMVRTLSDAQLLNAAWQAEVKARGLCDHTRRGWSSTDITRKSAGSAAGYASKYLAKQDLQSGKIPEELHGVYVDGTKGMRRCDAWGDWRPLGLSRREGSATHVGAERWTHQVRLGDYFGESELARWLRTGRASTGHLPDEIVTLLEHTDDLELLEASRDAAIAYAASIGVAVRRLPGWVSASRAAFALLLALVSVAWCPDSLLECLA